MIKGLLFSILTTLASYCAAQTRQAEIYTSSGNGLHRMTKTGKQVLLSDSEPATIRIHPLDIRQTILGFGGTYTEASAYNLKRLSKARRKEVIDAFFDPLKGAGWTMLRISMNSCDASSEYYSYCETEGDTALKTFSIQKDINNGMIPGLQAMLRVQPRLKIFAAPWTPPVWMKDSRVFNKGSLLESCYPAWALYFSKFITAYQKKGIPIWSVSPQNEPAAWEQRWDACGWSPGTMHRFVQNFLGPQLKKDHPSVGLMAFDHNKNFMLQWLDSIMPPGTPSPYYSTIAHHWYEEGEAKNFEPVELVGKKYPSMPIIASEQGVFGLYLMKPEPAELYARDLMGNMKAGSAAWIVWGMAFDHEGGPNHAGNFNHSPIMIDVKQDKVYYNPSYYYIAQFSRFVLPGDHRVGCTNTNPRVEAVAFKNTEGKTTLVILNTGEHNETLTIQENKLSLTHTIEAHSIVTMVF